MIAIGASTGGTEAIERLLRDFPADAPGTLVVQHLPGEERVTGRTPERVSLDFVRQLDAASAMTVREARDGDQIEPGVVLVAPAGRHLEVDRHEGSLLVRTTFGLQVHHHRPAVDVLFHSVARACGRRAVGALLTGMGTDGARGLLAMRAAGAHTIAQDEATSVVYGMPREAALLNAAVEVLPLEQMALALVRAGRAAGYLRLRATPP